MSDKNWLIRTHKNQILGPVSKQKIIEFLDGGALSQDDEVTSGNGYWFWIKEKDLVDRYIRGDIPQTFNPISEAKDVITASLTENKTASISRIPSHQPKAKPPEISELPKNDDLELPDSDLNLPGSDDLELPDMDLVSVEVTQTEASVSEGKKKIVKTESREGSFEEENIKYPSEKDLELPVLITKAQASSQSTLNQPQSGKSEVDEADEVEIEIEIEDSVDLEEEELPFVDETQEEEEKPVRLPSAKKKIILTQVAEEETEEAEAEEEEEEEEEIEERPIVPPKKKKTTEAPKKPESKNNKKRTRVVQTPVRNDNYLRYILVVIVIGIVAVLYYYFKLLNHPLPEISSVFINNAIAQTPESTAVIKKKVLLK